MFITMPIKSFKLEGNKVIVNESVIEYEDISDSNREILESLISKGAYGSALLTLNKFYNVKYINESECTNDEYLQYLKECNKLMEECVIETKAHNFRPLINLDGLEIMESKNHIARGKGDRLLIEDFRNQKILKEDSYEDPFFQEIENALYDAGFNVSRYSDVGMMTKNLGWVVSNSEGEVNLTCAGTYLSESKRLNEEMSPWMKYQNQVEQIIENAKSEMEPEMFDDFCEAIRNMLSDIVNGYRDTLFDDGIYEECEGTQCSDIAEKKDQEVGKLQKPKKNKHIVEAFKVPKNHGFKGFMLNEQGLYTRGNYILINENGSIRAINKKLLEDYSGDYYLVKDLAEQKAQELVNDINSTLNIDEIDEPLYNFGYRIEDHSIKIFDKNECFYYQSSEYTNGTLDEIVRKHFENDKDIYVEPENSVIFVICNVIVEY